MIKALISNLTAHGFSYMEAEERSPFILLMLLLAVGSCLVVQGTPINNECHILCQENDKCKTSLIGNTCYAHFEGERKYWMAQNWCSDYNMEMVNLPNESEASAIAELMKFVGSGNIWLGGSTVDLGNWTFVNGNLLNTDEFPLFKYMTSSQGCGAAYQKYENGHRYTELKVKPCNSEFPYICRSGSSVYLYQPITKKKNWFEARKICHDIEGDLFYPKNGETVMGLLDNFTKVEKENESEVFFIGLRHQKWEWQDGREVSNTNWNSNEQKSEIYQRNCLMLKDGKLSAEVCFEKGQVICQKELPKSNDITLATPTISDESEMPTKTPSTQIEQLTSIEDSTPQPIEELSLNTTPGLTLTRNSTIWSSTAAYFTVVVFLGGSLLLLVVAFPVVLCLIKRQKKETNDQAADDQEMEDHIYCEVALDRIPSRIEPRQNDRRSGTPSITQEHSQQNNLAPHIDRRNASMTTPFSRTSVDDVVIMDNHLYGSTEDIVEECGQRRFKTDSPQNPRMSDETASADNHLPGISEVPDEDSDINEASSDMKDFDSDSNEACSKM